MSRVEEEPDKVFGMNRGGIGPRARQDYEPRRVLGIPVDWYGPSDGQRRVLGIPVDWYGPADGLRLQALRHPVKAYKRWTLIRRLGPYAPDDEDDPTSTG